MTIVARVPAWMNASGHDALRSAGQAHGPDTVTAPTPGIFMPARALGVVAANRYRRRFDRHFPQAPADLSLFVCAFARYAIEWLGRTNAPYHDLEHSLVVTEVATLILEGRIAAGEAVEPEDWLAATAAALIHDIGYVRGICEADRGATVAIDAGQTATLSRGGTDARLAPWHISRGMLFARERLSAVPYLDIDRLAQAIGYTRFPVPDDPAMSRNDHEPGLMRAADLIGQLADPLYPRKVAALYAEFVETGEASRMGYRNAQDIWAGFPDFFAEQVAPHVGAARGYLSRSEEGNLWLESLERNLALARRASH
ncbi:MAG: metal-dependent phosphohydrolase [Pseudomonadota bacterium]